MEKYENIYCLEKAKGLNIIILKNVNESNLDECQSGETILLQHN